MNPNEVIRPGNFCNRFAEGLVNGFVGLPVLLLIYGIERKVMKEGPNGLITKAIIEISNIFRGKKNGMAVVFFEFVNNLSFLVWGDFIFCYSWPAYPLALMRLSK